MVAVRIEVEGAGIEPSGGAPEPGEHTKVVLSEAGWDRDRIEQARAPRRVLSFLTESGQGHQLFLSSFAVMIGTANGRARDSKSFSPVTSASAPANSASSRKGRSNGSRHSGTTGASRMVTGSHQGR